jgi:hypothetical protein
VTKIESTNERDAYTCFGVATSLHFETGPAFVDKGKSLDVQQVVMLGACVAGEYR